MLDLYAPRRDWQIIARWYRWRAATGQGHWEQVAAVNNGAYYQGA